MSRPLHELEFKNSSLLHDIVYYTPPAEVKKKCKNEILLLSDPICSLLSYHYPDSISARSGIMAKEH